MKSKERKSKYDKDRREKLGPEINAKRREWYKKNPNIIKNQILKSKYGISLMEYDAISARQNNLCDICKKPESAKRKNNTPFTLSVDHCHKTGKIRSLLCTNCNNGIGKFKEDVGLLAAAIDYIKRHQ